MMLSDEPMMMRPENAEIRVVNAKRNPRLGGGRGADVHMESTGKRPCQSDQNQGIAGALS